MKYLILIIFFLLVPLVSADTTFFDNPDDVFIMGNSPTGAVVDSGTTGGSGGGGCTYKWNCTNWNECLPYGMQIRNCANIGTCPDTYKSPEIEQNCTYTTSPDDETEKIYEQDETEKINGKEIVNNKIFIYFIISLVILFIIFYLKKDYFKKLIRKIK